VKGKQVINYKKKFNFGEILKLRFLDFGEIPDGLSDRTGYIAQK
jgi:hypothetical protein